jgi:hypothetical protein
MPISREDLEAVVRDGLVSDIFRAERAIAILKVSGTRSDEINRGHGNYGELFGALQNALTTEAILALARIYDMPDRRFATRCLTGVLDFLNAQQDELPAIREPHQLELSLRAMQAPQQLLTVARERPNDFAPTFGTFARALMAVPERTAALEGLKRLRDKALAHNEHVAPFEGPSWNALIELTELAKQIVGVLGWAYFSTAYTPDGKYLLTEDARRPSRALDRLLNSLLATATFT